MNTTQSPLTRLERDFQQRRKVNGQGASSSSSSSSSYSGLATTTIPSASASTSSSAPLNPPGPLGSSFSVTSRTPKFPEQVHPHPHLHFQPAQRTQPQIETPESEPEPSTPPKPKTPVYDYNPFRASIASTISTDTIVPRFSRSRSRSGSGSSYTDPEPDPEYNNRWSVHSNYANDSISSQFSGFTLTTREGPGGRRERGDSLNCEEEDNDGGAVGNARLGTRTRPESGYVNYNGKGDGDRDGDYKLGREGDYYYHADADGARHPRIVRSDSAGRKSIAAEIGQWEEQEPPTDGHGEGGDFRQSSRSSTGMDHGLSSGYSKSGPGLGAGLISSITGVSGPPLKKPIYNKRPPPPPPPISTFPPPHSLHKANSSSRILTSSQPTTLTDRTCSTPSPGLGLSPNSGSNSTSSPSRPSQPFRTVSTRSHRSIASPEAEGEHQFQLGITAHQNGQLAESALHFRISAEVGHSAGLLFYGLSLRHGWGIVQDERRGFAYLEKACESATTKLSDGSISISLQPSSMTVNGKPRPELIMALYELGNSYLQAWGPKSADPKLAMAYYRSAAMLGDRDAQEQLGFLLSTGRQGVKKDLKEAAKWYRAAVKQDASSVGLSWIYKEKYLDETA